MEMKEKISSLSSKATTNYTLCRILAEKYCLRKRETRSVTRKKQLIENSLIKIQNITNKIDPITRKIVRYEFALYRNGVFLYYDAKVLYKYIYTSGDLRDPITREEYKLHELMRLDRIVKKKFKISENVEVLKTLFKMEQERVLLRDHFLEEYTNLFLTFFSHITEDFESFVFFTENSFIPAFVQVRENSYLTCLDSELRIHKKYIKQRFLQYSINVKIFNVNSVEIVLNFINKI